MIARQKQVLFFENLIEKIGDKNKFVVSLSETLSISRDGVYRRLRGETPLTIDDLELLSRQFHFSVDEMLQDNNPGLLTKYEAFETFDWERFLQGVKSYFQHHDSRDEFQVYYNAKEIPIFYLFQFPELMAFKCYFWDYTFFADKPLPPFNPNSLSITEKSLGNEILKHYGQISSDELWGKEMLNATLKQIVYFYEIEEIQKPQVLLLKQRLLDLVDFLESVAEAGTKNWVEDSAKVNIYLNELLIGDNTLIAKNQNQLRAYLSQNIISSVIVEDEQYCAQTLKTFQTIAKKSTLISGSSEKVRKKFFKELRKEIENNLIT